MKLNSGLLFYKRVSVTEQCDPPLLLINLTVLDKGTQQKHTHIYCLL